MPRTSASCLTTASPNPLLASPACRLIPASNDRGWRAFGTYAAPPAHDTLGVAFSAACTSEPYQTSDWNAWDYSRLSGTPGAPFKINGVKMWYEASTLKRLGLNGTVQARVNDSLTMTWDGFYSKFKDHVNQNGVEFQGTNLIAGPAENGLVKSGSFSPTIAMVEGYTQDRDA